jgi:hypothetical protein
MVDKVNYKVVEGWEQLPGFAHRDVAGVAVDQGRVYLICRGENSDRLRPPRQFPAWGRGDSPCARMASTSPQWHHLRHRRRQPHGSPVHPEGRLLATMGTLNVPSDTGYDGKTTGSIKHAGPIVQPSTNVAIGPKGDIYISTAMAMRACTCSHPAGN